MDEAVIVPSPEVELNLCVDSILHDIKPVFETLHCSLQIGAAFNITAFEPGPGEAKSVKFNKPHVFLAATFDHLPEVSDEVITGLAVTLSLAAYKFGGTDLGIDPRVPYGKISHLYSDGEYTMRENTYSLIFDFGEAQHTRRPFHSLLP